LSSLNVVVDMFKIV